MTSGPTLLRVADLSNTNGASFDLRPDGNACAALARHLNLQSLRKLRFQGEIAPDGKRDWVLKAQLGATVVQPCVVTLEPVTTRFDVPIDVRFVAEFVQPDAPETEMPDDETIEALPESIDLAALMEESLALNLPQYPRSSSAELGDALFSPPDTAPLTDEAARPFAGLAALRDSLDSKD